MARSRKRPELEEVVALAAVHRRGGEPDELVAVLDDAAQELVRLVLPAGVLGGAPHRPVEPVDPLPHVDADLLADLAQVLARGMDARGDRVLVAAIEGELMHERDDVVGAAVGHGRLQAVEDAMPVPARRLRRAVERQVGVDVDQARRVLGALEVAARSSRRRRRRVTACGSSPAPSGYSSTQVSLLPPPWEELTTSDPRRSATRVRPPGTDRRLAAEQHVGAQVDVRGPGRRRRTGTATRDSASVGWAM